GSAPEHLDEVGALRVPESGGAFGIDRERPLPAGERLDRLEVLLARVDDAHLRVLRIRRRDRWGRLSHASPVGGGVTRRRMTEAAPRACTAGRTRLRPAPPHPALWATRRHAVRVGRRHPGPRARRTPSRALSWRYRTARSTAHLARRARR